MLHVTKKSLPVFILGAATVAAILIGAFVLIGQPNPGLAMEANATLGTMPGIDPAQRLKDLQNQLDESMIAFSVNTHPEFSPSGNGNLMVENPGNNAKLITAEIMLSDSEQIIYKSNAIQPGTYLQSIQLDTVPAPGVYDAVVYIKGYRLDDQKMIGQTGAQIKLTITK